MAAAMMELPVLALTPRGGKAGCTAVSRSTSAGSSPSVGQRSLDMSLVSSSSPFYPTSGVGLPEYDYPAPWSMEEHLIVKNTFLGTNTLRTPSFEEFFQERKTKSCPVSGISLPPGLEDLVEPEVAAARLVAAEAAMRSKAELPMAAPSEQALPQPFVLDLMEALSSAPEPRWIASPPAFQAQFSASPQPELGSADCPTIGSQGHWLRNCKPCAFLYTKGCGNGVACPFCHLCEPGEKKRRSKENRAALRSFKENGVRR